MSLFKKRIWQPNQTFFSYLKSKTLEESSSSKDRTGKPQV